MQFAILSIFYGLIIQNSALSLQEGGRGAVPDFRLLGYFYMDTKKYMKSTKGDFFLFFFTKFTDKGNY